MMSAQLPSVPRIGRMPYLLRLVMWFLLGFLLYRLTTMMVRSTVGVSMFAFVLTLVASFLVNVVGAIFVVVKYVFVPRLRDAGFDQPFLWPMVFLCLFPATSPILVVTLCLLPRGFVHIPLTKG